MTWLTGRRNLLRKTLTVAAVILAISAALANPGVPASTEARANSEFMPLAEVKAGMRGIGKTVIGGTKVDTFGVEVLGVLKGETATGDLILVRVSGKTVDATGGIAAGMSGSPVYIDGRLAGAIAFAYKSADHFVGLATPIEEMLKVFQAAGRRPPSEARLSRPVRVGDRLVRRAVLAGSPEEACELAALEPDDTLVMAPVMTPVMVSGMRQGRAFDRLSRRLEDLGFMPVQAGGAQEKGFGGSVDLEPGSAVGVQLMRGDVSVTAVGTVTYRKGRDLLAFGHHVLLKGSSGYIATGAEIHHVVPGIVMPFKVASPLGVAGTVVQDRTCGILVDVGGSPNVIPVGVTVRDQDTGTIRMFRADLVHDELLATDLTGAFALSCLDAAMDRIGPGTSRVSFEIRGRGLPEPVMRDNMFYSALDVSAGSIGELLDALSAIMDNEFAEVEVTGIKAEFEVRQARQTARIVQAQPGAEIVKPGDAVEVNVRIHPFRGVPEIKTVKVQVPENTPPGLLYLTVRGGGIAPEEDHAEKDDGKSAQRTVAESLEKLVNDLTGREKNNDIVVEFYPGELVPGDAIPVEGGGEPEPDGEPVMQGRPSQAEEPPRGEDRSQRGSGEKPGVETNGVVKATLATGYVIEGETSFELEIEGTETTVKTAK